ncbi:MAG: M20 family metallopeptidase [Sebaldella sp.]|nr:M20 family metallopeptidase [Sebaldella sp.]
MFEILNKTFENKKSEYLECLKKFLSIDTQTIGHGILGGKEKEGQEYIESLLLELGAEIRKEDLDENLLIKAYENYNEGNLGHNNKDRYNVIGEFPSKKEKILIFNGHVDTMPYGDKSSWSFDPLSPMEKDGKIYGLGSTDMKGGLMASIMAVKLIKDSGFELPCRVKIMSVADEEGGGNGTITAMMNKESGDGAVVCEPSDNQILTAHMGFVFFKVSVKGVALHSAGKWNGVNAIEKAIELIRDLGELEREWLMKYKHQILPPPTLNVGVINGGTAGSTVPDFCEFKVCVHYLPEIMSFEQVKKDFEETIYLRSKGDKFLAKNTPEIEIYQQGSGFEIDKDDEFVEFVRKNSNEISDIPINGGIAGNDARLLKNIGKIPTVILGPGRLEDCHSIDESLDIEEYFKYIKIYVNLIINF